MLHGDQYLAIATDATAQLIDAWLLHVKLVYHLSAGDDDET